MKKTALLEIIAILILLLSGCAGGEKADEGTHILWESIKGPPGAGRVVELIQNPTGGHELYALTEERALYKSKDKGENWQLMNDLQDIEANSIATYEDKLFIGGSGVYFYDNENDFVQIYEHWGNVEVSGEKLFLTSGGEDIKHARILYSDLTSEGFVWHDITPSASTLSDLDIPPSDIGLLHSITVSNVAAVDSRIMASVIVEVEGRGELTNDNLYCSEDLGETWSKVDLDVPDDVIISNIIQDTADPEHILLLFRHPIVHEVTHPVSELIRESYDGGETWNRVANLTRESNGITDCAILGSAYYLANPYDGYILKLDGTSHELIDMPLRTCASKQQQWG